MEWARSLQFCCWIKEFSTKKEARSFNQWIQCRLYDSIGICYFVSSILSQYQIIIEASRFTWKIPHTKVFILFLISISCYKMNIFDSFFFNRPLQLKTPPPKISVITPLRSPKKDTTSPHKNVDLNKHTLIHHFNFEKDESSKRVHKELLLKENKALEKKELVEVQNSNSVDSNNSNSNSANPLFLLSPPINSSVCSFVDIHLIS